MSVPRVRPVLLAGSVALAVILSGCAPEPAPTPAEAPTDSPSPTSSAEALPVPTSMLDIGCADLLPAGVGGGLLLERLGPLESTTGFLSDLPARPYEYATVQTGGLECAASNGEPRLNEEGLNPAAVAVYVRAVPDAGAFDAFRETQPQPDTPVSNQDRIVSCIGGTVDECYLDLLVGDVWVAYVFSGVDPTTVAAGPDVPLIQEIADSAAATVGAAARTGATWAAPPDAEAITDDCAQFFSTDTVREDLGLEEVLFGPYEEYESAELAARQAAPALLCPWNDQSGRVRGGHDVLSGGEWAYRQVEAERGVEGWEALPAEGLADDDVAVSTCDVVPDRCIANLVIGRNWVQITVLLEPNDLDAAAAARELTSLATSTVAAIRS